MDKNVTLEDLVTDYIRCLDMVEAMHNDDETDLTMRQLDRAMRERMAEIAKMMWGVELELHEHIEIEDYFSPRCTVIGLRFYVVRPANNDDAFTLTIFARD